MSSAAVAFSFFTGAILGGTIQGLSWYVQPRRGVPSRMERLRHLAQREQEWMQWAVYVAGLVSTSSIKLPAYPGTPDWYRPAPGEPGYTPD